MVTPLRRMAVVCGLVAAAATLRGQQTGTDHPASPDEGFRFKSGVELINVTATVSDSNGRFVPGLTQEDFAVYEDDQPQTVAQFSAERVPVSLGIALDTSGSMAGDKIESARSALNRFLYDLLDPHDEIFLYRFSNFPVLLQGWTSDRERLSNMLGRIIPNGGTAMYDTIAEAIPLAEKGANRKKALVIISDGNDTASHTDVRDLKQLIRESEVLVYAVGIDGDGPDRFQQPSRPVTPPRLRAPTPFPVPFPFPRPGSRLPGSRTQQQIFGPGGRSRGTPNDNRVNAAALRDMTDDSGGRTEIVRDPQDLDPATAGIADELSKQYYIGYTSSGKKDARWHTIRVTVKNSNYLVRARKGYIAN